MYLTYVDESGVPNKSNENFVVAGIIVNENKWMLYDSEVTQLKNNLFGSKWELYELHMADIVHGKKLYSKVSEKDRARFINEIFTLVNKFNVRIVASIIKTNKIYADKDIELWGLRLFFERLVLNLEDLNIKLKESGSEPQMGIIISDSINNKYDNQRREKFKEFFNFGTYYVNNKYIIEDVLFTDSHWRNMNQLADCVAYVINHANKINKNKNPEIFKALMYGFFVVDKKMEVGKSGSKSFSFKIFPEK